MPACGRGIPQRHQGVVRAFALNHNREEGDSLGVGSVGLWVSLASRHESRPMLPRRHRSRNQKRQVHPRRVKTSKLFRPRGGEGWIVQQRAVGKRSLPGTAFASAGSVRLFVALPRAFPWLECQKQTGDDMPLSSPVRVVTSRPTAVRSARERGQRP